MLRLTKGQRALLAEKCAELANLAAAAMVFGQTVSPEPFSPAAALAGTAVWVVLITAGFYLMGDTR